MASKYVSVEQKRQVELRADRRCEYCKSAKDYAAHTFHIEHIIPVFVGGVTSLDNLALACGGCNGRKASKVEAIDPISKAKAALFHPRQQRWSDHFIWGDECLEIVGITPCGRATVEALKLNQPEVVNLRRIMVLADLHPPRNE